MKRKYRLMIWGLVLFMSVFVNVKVADAANNAGFEVIPVASKQQLNQKVTYFDLKLAPNQATTVTVNVKSTSQTPITVETSVAKATTNTNGVVEYKAFKQNKSWGLPANIEKVVTTDQNKIQLQPGEVKPVTYQIKMPKAAFDGELVGGLNFVKKVTDDKVKTNSSMGVKNQYAYTIAMVLHGQQELTKNKMSLGKITTRQINNRNVISIPLNNQTAAFLNKVTTKVTIKKQGQAKAVYTQKTSDGQMAPNSVYELPVRIGETAFRPGRYTAQVVVTSKQQHWQFTKDFTITKKQARHYNQKAVIKEDDSWLGLSLIITGIVLLLILIIVIYWRKQRRIKLLESELAASKRDSNQ